MPFPYRLPSITRTSIQACGLPVTLLQHCKDLYKRRIDRFVHERWIGEGCHSESHYDVIRKTLSHKGVKNNTNAILPTPVQDVHACGPPTLSMEGLKWMDWEFHAGKYAMLDQDLFIDSRHWILTAFFFFTGTILRTRTQFQEHHVQGERIDCEVSMNDISHLRCQRSGRRQCKLLSLSWCALSFALSQLLVRHLMYIVLAIRHDTIRSLHSHRYRLSIVLIFPTGELLDATLETANTAS
jgi:hypothetical protein